MSFTGASPTIGVPFAHEEALRGVLDAGEEVEEVLELRGQRGRGAGAAAVGGGRRHGTARGRSAFAILSAAPPVRRVARPAARPAVPRGARPRPPLSSPRVLPRLPGRARGLEPAHLEVLVDGDLVPQALQELLLGQFLDLAAARGAGDEIDVHRLEHLAEDQLARAVPVREDGDGLSAREVLHRLGDARPLDRDDVLDPAAQQVQHVRAALDDDERVRLVDVRPAREVLGPVGRDLLDLDRLADGLGEVEPDALSTLPGGGRGSPSRARRPSGASRCGCPRR